MAPSSPSGVAVPRRHPSGWPTRRAPRWLLLAGLILVAAAVLVGWAHRPTRGQRAADMNGYLADMTTDIQSCAGGVRESLFAMRQIQSGAQTDLATAVHIAHYGASNCSPANNTQLDDLVQYQVHESLASFHLDVAANDLITWAFPDAQQVQNDVADVLTAHGTAAKAAATTKLHSDLLVLDAERSVIYSIMHKAVVATSATAKLPPLPG